jgi:hypothetical protein
MGPSTQLAVVGEEDDVALRPMTALGVMLGLSVGVYVGSLLVAVVLVAIALGAAALRGLHGHLRHGIGRHAARRRHWERRRLRDRRLADAGIPREGLLELTILADEIARVDAALAQRFDLDDLLDRHVELALAHDRCLRAMRMADREHLSRARADQLAANGSRRRAEVYERRIRCWDLARERADRCADELATLADFVRLLAQKAACPDVLLDEDGLDRRLGELDEEEHAFRQLSAGGS